MPGRATRFVIVLAVIYTLFLSYFSIRAHWALQTAMNDLGNMEQAIWQASQGNFTMPVSNHVYPSIVSRTAIHANFIFLLIAPFYKILPYSETLLFLTTFACAAAGLGLYFYARHHLRQSPWAVIVPAAFWLSPMVQDANLWDFHVVTLSTAFLVWAAWSIDTGRLKLGWAFLVLAILCKENMILVLAAYGLYLCLTRREKLGLQVIIFAAAYGILVLNFLIPAFTGKVSLMGPDNRFDWLLLEPQATLLQKVEKILTHLGKLSQNRIFFYLLLSGGLAALSAWPVFIIAIPEVLVGMLAGTSWMTRITGTYYWITSTAVVMMACTLAARPALERNKKPFSLIYLLSATLLFSFLFSPLPYGLASSMENFQVRETAALLQEINESMDPEQPLCVQNNIGAHFSKRRDVAVFPGRCRRPYQYLLFYLRWTPGPDLGYFAKTSLSTTYQFARPQSFINFAKKHLDSSRWGLIFQKEGFYLLEKGTASYTGREEIQQIFHEDAGIFMQEYRQAVQSRYWWSGYLNGGGQFSHLPQVWKRILHGPSRKNLS